MFSQASSENDDVKLDQQQVHFLSQISHSARNRKEVQKNMADLLISQHQPNAKLIDSVFNEVFENLRDVINLILKNKLKGIYEQLKTHAENGLSLLVIDQQADILPLEWVQNFEVCANIEESIFTILHENFRSVTHFFDEYNPNSSHADKTLKSLLKPYFDQAHKNYGLAIQHAAWEALDEFPKVKDLKCKDFRSYIEENLLKPIASEIEFVISESNPFSCYFLACYLNSTTALSARLDYRSYDLRNVFGEDRVLVKLEISWPR